MGGPVSTLPHKTPLLLFQPLLLMLPLATGPFMHSGSALLLCLSWKYQLLCSCMSHCGKYCTALCWFMVCCAVLRPVEVCCAVLLTKQQLSVLMIVLFSALGLYMKAVEGLQPLKRWASAVLRSTSPQVGCRTQGR
jgi:hypothetical protein